jgi:hypothetical protein
MALTRLRAKQKNALFGTLQAICRDYRAPPGVLFRVAVDLFESLDTPVSLSCEILLRYGEVEQLVRKTVNPLDYVQSSRFRDDVQAVSFLKKMPLEIEGVDPLAAAKEKFFASEVSCAQTNARFRALCAGVNNAPPLMKAILLDAVEEVQRVLGAYVNSAEWLDACRFGPGAFNHTDARGLTSLYDKLQVTPSVTHDLADVGALLVMSRPPWARSVTNCEIEGFWPLIKREDMDLVPGNRVAFVPKTAVTHRTIAIEPLVNIYAQLGIGRLMRRRLRNRCGLDLDDQLPNQELARRGSIDGSLATIDLSSASDTVARELVRFLLPHQWFERLDLCRSKVGYLDGRWLRYEKFSSMGNGCTFELETLIFWSLSIACVRHLDADAESVRVYGDDIIVPSEAYDLLVEVLAFCGFSTNSAKSFKVGPFRESCGKDFYDGHEVRPFFQKESLSEVSSLFRLANGIRRVAYRRNLPYGGCDSKLHTVWKSIVKTLPRPITQNLRVPAHAGDSDGICCNWDESQSSQFVISNDRGWEGVSGLRLQSTPLQVRLPTNLLGVTAAMLYRLKDGRTRQTLEEILGVDDSVPSPPRLGRDFEYRLRSKAFYGPWTDFGEWR